MDDFLNIRFEGQAGLQAKINALIPALDTQHLLDQGATILLHSMMDRFLRMQDTDGQPWQPIKPATERAKIKRWGGGGILYASGKLFRSLQVFQTGEDSRGIGTDVPYAKFHNFGTVNLPKREFIGITQSDTDLVQNILVTAVVKAFSSV